MAARKHRDDRQNASDRAVDMTVTLAEAINLSWKSITVGAAWASAANAAVREGSVAALNGLYPTLKAQEAFLDALSGLPDPLVTHLRLSQQAEVTLAMWQDTKTIYLLDDELWDALADTDPSGDIPEEVLRRLPHPNPYMAFPAPVSYLAENGDTLRYEGVWITGKKPVPDVGEMLCSTADPDVTSLALLFSGYAVDPATGRPSLAQVTGPNGSTYKIIDTALSRVSIPLVTESLSEHITRALSTLMDPGDTPSGGKFEDQMLPTSALGDLVRVTVIALVYLCSDESDIGPQQPRRPVGKKRGQNDTPPTVYPVGYRIGAALRKHRSGERSEPGEPTGRTVAPHIRRAHFHTFRAGVGRTERRVKWLAPIPVNIEKGIDLPTVHKVR